LIQLNNEIYIGSDNRKSLLDLTIPDNFNSKIILFSHGFMGYKDWGAWFLVEKFFTDLGYGFCKYNVSHNGGTVEQPIDFPDLEAFSKNTYSKELFDLKQVINWVDNQVETKKDFYLIGHSRGGGIVLLNHSDERVKKIATWAAISSIEKRFPEGKQLKVWETQGTKYVENSRTNQKMPTKFSQYEDFVANKELLNIQKACEESSTPTLVIHGDADTSVPLEEGLEICTWLKTRLFEIEEANHTFGATQPWEDTELPEHLLKVCQLTESFFSY
jgi:pimeloyl-ACP methyl ester carboxylesterase